MTPTTRLQERVGRRLCTLVLPPPSSSSSSDGPSLPRKGGGPLPTKPLPSSSSSQSLSHGLISTLAPCPPLIAFEKYILAWSTTGDLCVYSVVGFSDKDHYDSSRQKDHLSHSSPMKDMDNDCHSPNGPSNAHRQRRRQMEAQDAVFPIFTLSLSHERPLHSNDSNHPNPPYPPGRGAVITIVDMHTWSPPPVSKCQAKEMDEEDGSSFLGWIVSLSCDGRVFVVTLHQRNTPSTSSSSLSSSSSVWLTLEASYSIGECGATSLCLMPFQENDPGKVGTTKEPKIFPLAILTSHHTGIVQCHTVRLGDPRKMASGVSLESSDREEEDWRLQLCWKGSLYHPIRSLSSWSPSTLPSSFSSTSTSLIPSYLMMGVHPWKTSISPNGHRNDRHTREDGPHGGSLEVVDIVSLTHIYQRRFPRREGCLSLEQYCRWPGAGMELRTSDHLDRDRWKTLSRIGKTTNSSSSSSSSSSWEKEYGVEMSPTLTIMKSFHNPPHAPFVVTGMSNGLISISHCTSLPPSSSSSSLPSSSPPTEEDEEKHPTIPPRFEWGILDPSHEFLLPHPCIGIGSCMSWNLKHQYIICCLSGGTVYQIPLPVRSQKEDPWEEYRGRRRRIDCPTALDGTEDDVIRYVHGFTAGSVKMTSKASDSSLGKEDPRWHSSGVTSGTTPSTKMGVVMVYSWGAGMMDVYSGCQEDDKEEEKQPSLSRRRSLVWKLGENGTVEKLLRFLRTLEKEEELPQHDPLWKDAWKECRECNALISVMIQEMVEGDNYPKIQRLLLHISIGHVR